MGACMGASDESNASGKNQNESDKLTKPRRSGSMHLLWANSWKEVIEDRSANRMKSESEVTQCNNAFDECNCVKRVIFVMNIYKFWNDRKHIVE